MTRQKRCFSSETRTKQLPRMSTMNPKLIAIAASLAVTLAAPYSHAGNAPLDFAYRVTGAANVRPLMVFNDGVDTFIQPQDPADKNIRVNGSQPTRQGPYFVVRGIEPAITLSQGKTDLVSISYMKTPAARPTVPQPSTVVPADRPIRDAGPGKETQAQTQASESPKPAKIAGQPDTKSSVKDVVCEAYQERKDSALVASFKGSSSSLSSSAKKQIENFVRDVSDISSVEIIAEGSGPASWNKRGDTLRSLLENAGVRKNVIRVETRTATGIGSEIHVHRSVEIPCGAEIINIPSRRSNATIIWDRDAKLLAERMASQLQIPLTVEGVERPVPIRLAVINAPFTETMDRVGRVLDENADLILRKGELVLRFKEKK